MTANIFTLFLSNLIFAIDEKSLCETDAFAQLDILGCDPRLIDGAFDLEVCAILLYLFIEDKFDPKDYVGPDDILTDEYDYELFILIYGFITLDD